MNFPGPILIILSAFLPFLGLLVYAVLKQRRQARLRDESAGKPEPFFAPEEPKVHRLLARFEPRERTYLVQFLPPIRFGLAINAWIFFVTLSSGLLPQYVNQYGTEQALAQRVWYSYLLHVSSASVMLGILAYVGAFVAMIMTLPAQARFYRTRPLRRSFLFWASILPSLAALFGALAIAAACSFLLLLALYGPVWRHLMDAAHHTAYGMATVFLGSGGHTQGVHLGLALRTRPLLMLLSAATTMSLIFSLATVLFSLTLRSTRLRVVIVALSWVFIVFFSIFSMVGALPFPRASRLLFLYIHLGSPPPISYAFIPVVVSVALLFIAQKLAARLET